MDGAIEWLQQQLENCVTSHQGCKNTLEISKIRPTRLIDVGADQAGSQICLIQTDGISSPYIALSHRWGTTWHLTTTKSNISEMQQGIRLQDLPRTFSDAVSITRKFGIRYLWIDSLCIVQDDPKDWEIEASRMAGVYSGSYITIAAISSKDSNSGCVPEVPSEYFEIRRTGNQPCSIYVRPAREKVLIGRAHMEVSGGWQPLQIPLVSAMNNPLPE
jgi:Heterokaryon incompatibility protein (HET)